METHRHVLPRTLLDITQLPSTGPFPLVSLINLQRMQVKHCVKTIVQKAFKPQQSLVPACFPFSANWGKLCWTLCFSCHADGVCVCVCMCDTLISQNKKANRIWQKPLVEQRRSNPLNWVCFTWCCQTNKIIWRHVLGEWEKLFSSLYIYSIFALLFHIFVIYFMNTVAMKLPWNITHHVKKKRTETADVSVFNECNSVISGRTKLYCTVCVCWCVCVFFTLAACGEQATWTVLGFTPFAFGLL